MLFDKINEEKIEKLLYDNNIIYRYIAENNLSGYKFKINNIPYELWFDEYCEDITFGIVKREFDKPVQTYVILKTKSFKNLKSIISIISKEL